MNSKLIKAVLIGAFIVLTSILTYSGLNKKEASIDFAELAKEKAEQMSSQNADAFENVLKNIGSSTTIVKPDILQSNDTGRLALSIRLLDSMRQYVYAGVLSEKLANIQHSPNNYYKASYYFLLATEKKENELMLFKKSKSNLEKCLEIDPDNLQAKVELAVSTYNIFRLEPPQNPMDNMKPAKLLLQVVQKDSNHIDGLYYLGKLSVESNQLEKAIARFKKLVSLQPQNPVFYHELSEIYRMKGDLNEAQAWNDKAQALK
ncbi:MAG: hypothetical protein R2852_07545 [Bacteroidia bacterium]